MDSIQGFSQHLHYMKMKMLWGDMKEANLTAKEYEQIFRPYGQEN